jgi:hypothetical protein
MGLDMYLSAKKYMSKYFDPADVERIKQVNDIFGVTGVEDEDYGAEEVKFRVAYWRKANAIHQWFVENCQEGNDDCSEYWVSREQLQELVDICEQIMADRSKAEELLPTQSGFFFGDTAYDEWYFMGVEYTVQRFKKILSDTALQKVDFYYQSSW